MEKYLITYNQTEVVTVSETSGGGTIKTGTNVLITTLEGAITMLDAIGVDYTLVQEEIDRNKNLTE